MTTTLRPRALLAVCSALTTGALLAACGGGSSGGSDAAAPGGATAAASDAVSDASSDSGGDSSANGGAPDPCSLITAADLSSAYGVTFGEGATDDSDVAAQRGFRACKWSDDSGTKAFVLQTVASGDPLGQTASQLFDDSAGLYPDSTDGGVGDKSVLLKDEGGFLAVKGDVFVQGNPIIFGGETPTGATKTVMTSVVSALD